MPDPTCDHHGVNSGSFYSDRITCLEYDVIIEGPLLIGSVFFVHIHALFSRGMRMTHIAPSRPNSSEPSEDHQRWFRSTIFVQPSFLAGSWCVSGIVGGRRSCGERILLIRVFLDELLQFVLLDELLDQMR